MRCEVCGYEVKQERWLLFFKRWVHKVDYNTIISAFEWVHGGFFNHKPIVTGVMSNGKI